MYISSWSSACKNAPTTSSCLNFSFSDAASANISRIEARCATGENVSSKSIPGRCE